ncbi:MAG TPA: general secretion pathway protein GspK [Acidobacteriota bacterium]|nr:general secretion pathway protein GspK [Acidobacteriota bacterium]
MTVVNRQSFVVPDLPIAVTPPVRIVLPQTNVPLRTSDYRLTTGSGVILIALLWILVALSGIALSFSREGFVEVAAARNAQSLENAYYVARAGIASTVYQLMEKRILPTVTGAQLQETPDPVDLGIVTGEFGGGTYRVDIQDESGKINLNIVSAEQMHALAEAIGIPQEDADIIVDSILDWRDSDKLTRLNGAEDDYYQTMNPPYKAKNGRFDTVEELLLVRGITPTYFYGYPERTVDNTVVYRYGLSRYFTVYSNRNQININFAPLPVLLSIPGMPADAAKMIYERRLVKPFKNTAELNSEIPVNIGTQTMPLLTTQPTDIFTLTASAHAERSKAKRIIRAVISLQRESDNAPYQTLYWNENVPDYESVTP